MNIHLEPSEISKELVSLGVKKAKHSIPKMILLGFLAGAYIAFAAHLATVASTGWQWGGTDIFPGLKKVISGAVFSVGLMLVLIPGSELFTGNCLMPVALYSKRITLKSMLKNWLVVWLANFTGALFLAVMIAGFSGLLEGEFGKTAVKIASGKAGLPLMQMFIRGILANWIVCLAVMMCLAAKDIGGKVLGIFFPIMAFVASGFEHSIANMYFIPAGLIARNSYMAAEAYPDLTLLNGLSNILIVTAGNIVGGALFVATSYYYLYVREPGQHSSHI